MMPFTFAGSGRQARIAAGSRYAQGKRVALEDLEPFL